MYVYGGQVKSLMFVWLYVDDMIVFSLNKDGLERVKREIGRMVELKDLGELTHVLNIKVSRGEDGSFILNQGTYIDHIVHEYDRLQVRSAHTPYVTPNVLVKREQGKATPEEESQYRSVVGELSYLAGVSRPDLQYIVSRLQSFANNPGPEHWRTVAHTLRYIHTTRDLCLVLGGGSTGGFDIEGYVDASWKSEPDSGRSVSGYVVKVMGAPVSWYSKKQDRVATSTEVAELLAMSAIVKEIEWMKILLEELGMEKVCAKIHCDNKGAVVVAQHPTNHSKVKHLEVSYFYVRECLEKKWLAVEWIEGTQQVADIFTKPLGRQKFEWCLGRILIIPESNNN